jgi:antirestriction protein ArdC
VPSQVNSQQEKFHVPKCIPGGGVVRRDRVPVTRGLVRTEKDAKTGDDVEHVIPYLKGYTVFNVEQIDGLPAPFYAQAEKPRLAAPDRIAHAEQFFAATGADVHHGGSRAFYRPSTDSIVLPMFEAFRQINPSRRQPRHVK